MMALPGNLRSASAVLIAAAMIHAPLAKADAQMIAVSNCSGGMSLLVIPGDDNAPKKSGGGDCAKACHGISDRRGKALVKRTDPAR